MCIANLSFAMGNPPNPPMSAVDETVEGSVKLYEYNADNHKRGIFEPSGSYLMVETRDGVMTLSDCNQNDVCEEGQSLALADLNVLIDAYNSHAGYDVLLMFGWILGAFAMVGVCAKSANCTALASKVPDILGALGFFAVVIGGSIKTTELLLPNLELKPEVRSATRFMRTKEGLVKEVSAGSFDEIKVLFSRLTMKAKEFKAKK